MTRIREEEVFDVVNTTTIQGLGIRPTYSFASLLLSILTLLLLSSGSVLRCPVVSCGVLWCPAVFRPTAIFHLRGRKISPIYSWGLVICELRNGESVKCELKVRIAGANRWYNANHKMEFLARKTVLIRDILRPLLLYREHLKTSLAKTAISQKGLAVLIPNFVS